MRLFPFVAIVTNYHKLSGLKQCNFIILQFCGSQVGYWSHWYKTKVLAGLPFFLGFLFSYLACWQNSVSCGCRIESPSWLTRNVTCIPCLQQQSQRCWIVSLRLWISSVSTSTVTFLSLTRLPFSTIFKDLWLNWAHTDNSG